MELMATVVIIGIVSAMAVPRFQEAFERIKFRSANRDLTTALRVARSAAITEKSQYGVHFNDSRLVVVLFKDTNNPGALAFEPASDSIIRVDSMPPEITYLDTDLTGDCIFFRANGAAQFTGGGNVVCMAQTENMVAISNHNVLASTGRVQSNSSYY